MLANKYVTFYYRKAGHIGDRILLVQEDSTDYLSGVEIIHDGDIKAFGNYKRFSKKFIGRKNYESYNKQIGVLDASEIPCSMRSVASDINDQLISETRHVTTVYSDKQKNAVILSYQKNQEPKDEIYVNDSWGSITLSKNGKSAELVLIGTTMKFNNKKIKTVSELIDELDNVFN